MKEFFFNVLIASSIFGSIIVISSRHPIHSLFGLIGVVVSFVFILIPLGVEFFGLTMVTVYLGAVVVLFLFMVMMLDIKSSNLRKEFLYTWPVSFIFGGMLFYFIYTISGKSVGSYEDFSPFYKRILVDLQYIDYKSMYLNVTNIEAIGWLIYSPFAPWLLLVGIILLVAILGAVILTKTNYISNDRKRTFVDQQLSRNSLNSVFFARRKKKNNDKK